MHFHNEISLQVNLFHKEIGSKKVNNIEKEDRNMNIENKYAKERKEGIRKRKE